MILAGPAEAERSWSDELVAEDTFVAAAETVVEVALEVALETELEAAAAVEAAIAVDYTWDAHRSWWGYSFGGVLEMPSVGVRGVEQAVCRHVVKRGSAVAVEAERKLTGS